MTGDRVYYINQQPVSHQEALTLIAEYRKAVRRPFDRYARISTSHPNRLPCAGLWLRLGVFFAMIRHKRRCTVQGIDLDSSSIEVARGIVGKSVGLSFSV